MTGMTGPGAELAFQALGGEHGDLCPGDRGSEHVMVVSSSRRACRGRATYHRRPLRSDAQVVHRRFGLVLLDLSDDRGWDRCPEFAQGLEDPQCALSIPVRAVRRSGTGVALPASAVHDESCGRPAVHGCRPRRPGPPSRTPRRARCPRRTGPRRRRRASRRSPRATPRRAGGPHRPREHAGPVPGSPGTRCRRAPRAAPPAVPSRRGRAPSARGAPAQGRSPGQHTVGGGRLGQGPQVLVGQGIGRHEPCAGLDSAFMSTSSWDLNRGRPRPRVERRRSNARPWRPHPCRCWWPAPTSTGRPERSRSPPRRASPGDQRRPAAGCVRACDPGTRRRRRVGIGAGEELREGVGDPRPGGAVGTHGNRLNGHSCRRPTCGRSVRDREPRRVDALRRLRTGAVLETAGEQPPQTPSSRCSERKADMNRAPLGAALELDLSPLRPHPGPHDRQPQPGQPP